MIRSFSDKRTERFFEEDICPAQWRQFESIAKRKLDMIDAAEVLTDLRVPPGNRLEKLRGDLEGWHSIRINDQWRIIFRWIENEAHDVKIVDYH
jgi:toxin HigB-1